MAAAAAFFLRKKGRLAPDAPPSVSAIEFAQRPAPVAPSKIAYSPAASIVPADGNAALLHALKEELFAIESEKLSGAISAQEYAEVKAGLEAVLKRALKNR